jgi:hypothetical protein
VATCRWTHLTQGPIALLVHLNDLHDWDRKAIADFVEATYEGTP